MAKKTPPEPADSHAVIAEWMDQAMPGLQPVVRKADKLIRDAIPGLQYAVKWKKALYGLPSRGWIIEMVAYDVSVNLVFHGGGKFDPPPPLGEGASRYIKIREADELDTPEMKDWIEQAAKTPGWK
jgi:hypothetical protein